MQIWHSDQDPKIVRWYFLFVTLMNVAFELTINHNNDNDFTFFPGLWSWRRQWTKAVRWYSANRQSTTVCFKSLRFRNNNPNLRQKRKPFLFTGNATKNGITFRKIAFIKTSLWFYHKQQSLCSKRLKLSVMKTQLECFYNYYKLIE